jgi:hypothetical protein
LGWVLAAKLRVRSHVRGAIYGVHKRQRHNIALSRPDATWKHVIIITNSDSLGSPCCTYAVKITAHLGIKYLESPTKLTLTA